MEMGATASSILEHNISVIFYCVYEEFYRLNLCWHPRYTPCTCICSCCNVYLCFLLFDVYLNKHLYIYIYQNNIDCIICTSLKTRIVQSII